MRNAPLNRALEKVTFELNVEQGSRESSETNKCRGPVLHGVASQSGVCVCTTVQHGRGTEQ